MLLSVVNIFFSESQTFFSSYCEKRGNFICRSKRYLHDESHLVEFACDDME